MPARSWPFFALKKRFKKVPKMLALRKASLGLSLMAFLLTGTAYLLPGTPYTRLPLLLCAIFLSFGVGALPRLAGFQYTLWILTAVVAGLSYPEVCLGGSLVDMRNSWLILFVVQGVMFGMGTQMRISDFVGIFRRPKGVLIGLLCQFSIMPVVGFILAKTFKFPPEIGAGIILIGSCSSGLASNVMTYLAKANLALSVTVTACATLMAPLMTPLLMKAFAGTMVAINFWSMMMTITKIVIFPIGAALLHDHLRNTTSWIRFLWWKLGFVSLVWLAFMGFAGWDLLQTFSISPILIQTCVLLNFAAGAVCVGIAYDLIASKAESVRRLMPYFSMFGIIYFTTVTTAAGRDSLLTVGLLLLLVAILHNSAGYGLGYLFSRLLGLDPQSARAMALEVGLQNGGMASGLAGSMGMLGSLGLASAVFSPWMNISGSILANYWKANPPKNKTIT